jgi:hypothetical protein
MRSSGRKADHYRAETLFFLELEACEPRRSRFEI